MSRKVKLIFNPIANLGRAWPIAADLRPLVHELGGADWSGTVYPTHATELAMQAADDGYELVVAMGGDGTVHEVVNGLMQVPAERRPRLGLVPIGSGNDFAHALGVSRKPEEALRQALSGTPRLLDVGRVTAGDGRQEYWNNTLGMGFDTVVSIRSRKIPLLQGFSVYLTAVLQTILLNYFPFDARITTDREEWQENLLMLVLCNGPREGGGFYVAPQARTDDGLLHYVGVRHISRPRMLATLPHFLKGTQMQLSQVRGGDFTRMDIETDRPLHIHVDGEIFAGLGSQVRKLTVELLPGAIQAVV